MRTPESFWDMIAKNFDKSEKQFEQIHNQTIEKTKKLLKDTEGRTMSGGVMSAQLNDETRLMKNAYEANAASCDDRKKLDEIKRLYFKYTNLFNETKSRVV